VAGTPGSSSEQLSELTLHAGEQALVPLGGAGSVGYQWTWDIEGDSDSVVVSVEAEPSEPPAPGSEPHGGSRGQLLRVKGMRSGRATIHLALVRSFQRDRPPRARHTVSVEVRGT
jgi:hypothetical protein